MRAFFTLVLFAFAGITHAASIETLVFDDIAITGKLGNFHQVDTPQGYSILNPFAPTDILLRAAPGDHYLEVEHVFDTSLIQLVNISGSPFRLHELDVLFSDPAIYGYGVSSTDVVIRAENSAGELIAETTALYADGLGWRTLVFDETWTGITTLKLGYSLTDLEFALGGYDNIAVSAVPVPAAVWLFGSALAGLGWMRRRQTATIGVRT